MGDGEILVGEGGGLVVAFCRRRRRRRGTTAGAVEILIIATLNHEARDDAVEYRAPIRGGGSPPPLPVRPPNRRGGRSTEGGEISARYRALVGTELEYYPSGRRPGHGDAEMAEHSRIE